MSRTPRADKRYLVWVGAETDLIFSKGIDLPGFASFPLLETSDGRDLLTEYARAQIALAEKYGFGCILESATWIANQDRAAPLGYDQSALEKANRDAVALLCNLRDETPGSDILISANIGPRSDAYTPQSLMSPEEAAAYHGLQITSLRGSTPDLISGYTLSNVPEAIGIVQAASKAEFECVISFTVETDGTLPTGETLDAAIYQTDIATDATARYYMINCAHPDHFSSVLNGNPRLGGIVVNASRCSHAELDEATTLDDGNPDELGSQVARMAAAYPSMRVVGGCCGTDMRHLEAMAKSIRNA